MSSSEPFIGEIKLFAGNFQILGHAFCDGRVMSIADNTALFSLLGTTYGGDGQTTFNLPDLRGRFPVHFGTGGGLSPRVQGEVSGTETVTLIAAQLPAHTHALSCSAATGGFSTPGGNFWAAQPALNQYTANPVANNFMKSNAITNTGNSQAHDNMIPFLTINYLIALVGIFPARN